MGASAPDLARLLGRMIPELVEPQLRYIPLWIPWQDDRAQAVGGAGENSHEIFRVNAARVNETVWAPVFAKMDSAAWWESSGIALGQEARVFARVYALAMGLIVRNQFYPGMAEIEGQLHAVWHPFLQNQDRALLEQLGLALPAYARASQKPPLTAPAILQQMVARVVDALVRNNFYDTLPPSALGPPYGAWLQHLQRNIRPLVPASSRTIRGALVRWEKAALKWEQLNFRLLMRIEEPFDEVLLREAPTTEENDRRGQDRRWTIRLFSFPAVDPSLVRPINDDNTGSHPNRDVLMWWAEACRLVPWLEQVADASVPGEFTLDSSQLLDFLEQDAWKLQDAGIAVLMPSWWHKRKTRIGLKARITADKGMGPGIGDLNAVNWSLAMGDEALTAEEIQYLAALKEPLVKVRGQWIQLQPGEIRNLAQRLKNAPQRLAASEALRLALEPEFKDDPSIPVLEVETEGWLAEVIGRLSGGQRIEEIAPPEGFMGVLRPYQTRGVSWLNFLHQWGIGGCLADDMGLGKTVQTLALIHHDYVRGAKGPVLLICPTSVVGNWEREAQRFTPDLPVWVHHGSRRLKGEAFVEAVQHAALVITSYPLLRYDAAILEGIHWLGLVLDEAQNVKNPYTQQAQLVRKLHAGYRIALTGTPVENNVEELWALMDFLNPGLLGSLDRFRRDFGYAGHQKGDDSELGRLKRITGPFVLRRIKTDPAIINDLPDKVEIKEYCVITREQASLYQAVLDSMAERLAHVDGMARRGLILATLTHLKQVLNHPAHFLADGSPLAGRSGKLTRLEELVEEILTVQDHALIFTQYAEMGNLLVQHLQERFGQPCLFLHGGTKKSQRDEMVDAFQNQPHGPRLFVLSLRAGGTGLNLTRANHVIHYDRWWNPAVENQATDRAFRIGQHRNVEVHKFICRGTLEERIDLIIEEKLTLAERLVGSGEGWITELSADALRELLTLSADWEED